MNKRGFTLVELLVASSLFILSCSVFSLTLKTNKAYLQKARQVNQARLLLQNKIEATRQASFASLTGTKIAPDLIKVEIDSHWLLRSKY